MIENNTPANQTTANPLEPPIFSTEVQSSNWQAMNTSDPLIEYVTANLWRETVTAPEWQIARFSKAVYLVHELPTQWKIIVKYYTPKTGLKAERHAERELEKIRQVQSTGFKSGEMRAINAISAWRGVLFMEYVEGLTLADIIAMRRSQPGLLSKSLKSSAEFLAHLHSQCLKEDVSPTFENATKDATDYIQDLAKYGVLEGETAIVNSLHSLVDEWAGNPFLKEFSPCLNHGDATTTNFLFPRDGGVIGIDWERLEVADPAADLGRLAAEVAHNLLEQGGDSTEANQDINHLVNCYIDALPASINTDRIGERMRFYQAISTLRIARNGWIPRLKRFRLVTHAMALLIR